MSQQNVELVLALQRRLFARQRGMSAAAPDQANVDIMQLFRADERSAEVIEAVTPFFHPDVEVAHRLLGGDRTYFGLEGMWTSWRDWLSPSESYHAHLEDAIDCGEKVLLIVRDSGRREGSTAWVESHNAAIWTVRDGKIARAEFYADRDWARRDAGLADS